MDLIAVKSLAYSGKRYDVGESFVAGARDARILVAIGKARSAEVADVPVDAEPKPAKRAYKRRDMQAE